MKRGAIRAVTLCVLASSSSYLYWGIHRLREFDPAWPQGLPYPDLLIETLVTPIAQLPKYQGLICGSCYIMTLVTYLYCMFGLLALLSITTASPFLLHTIPFRTRPGHCLKCGYDIIASMLAWSTHCPECGHAIDPVEVLKKRTNLAITYQIRITRILWIACIHWSLFIGSILTSHLAEDEYSTFARSAAYTFGFPIFNIVINTNSSNLDLDWTGLIFNSLLWGLAITVLLEKSRQQWSRLYLWKTKGVSNGDFVIF